ncbi:P-loop ATPase, Sll1717 family [Novosphingobium sp. TCA1]|uniref:P-loop ATPase, Sll1717 family n=1 Tax=Novosphingobium sp. TCA1 TaxID=2682474 RepID=UPI00130709EC|nr:hypothetical protein [Novosphingobium sp. TCA1]GFE75388.1 hypothetical protein NTCA1_30370 [Novosphingobium sp. TCA1]
MTIQLDLSDETLFGNDAGEDESPEILASYFIDQENFTRFLKPTVKLSIARAKKGMGKSALISKFAYDRAQDGEEIIVKLVGSQLIGDSIPIFSTFLEAQSYWVRQICSRINAALGAKIGFAFSDTTMALVESAEITGLRERSLAGALLSRIKSKNIPIEITSTKEPDPATLLSRAMEKFSDKTVWLLVDDIDSTFKNDDRNRVSVSAFFSALRYISNNMAGVVTRSSVRSDVWANIREIEDLDKSEQYMTDIVWTRLQLQHMLSKKIWAWINRNKPFSIEAKLDPVNDNDQVLELAFARRIKWGTNMTPPFQPVNILSAGRPRWMAQLCRMAGEHAHSRKSKIQATDINKVMTDFARYRLNDLIKEHKHQFEKLEQLVRIFANSPSRYKAKELNKKILDDFVLRVGIPNIPKINEEEYKSPLQLADMLFQTGFIVARYGESDRANLVEFRTYTDEPELLKYGMPRSEELNFEIYPSYRVASQPSRRRVV